MALKQYYLGTHRSLPPAETLRRAEACYPQAGITRLADITHLDRLGVPVYQAVRPASRNLSVSQGKGATVESSKASAVMEAIELWHAEDLSHLPMIQAAPLQILNDNPVALHRLPWRGSSSGLLGMQQDWLAVTSLDRERQGWVPRSLFELDLLGSERWTPRPFRQTSNGLASGNCFEEALLHGLYELIERHALALVRRQPEGKRTVDLDHLDDPASQDLVERIRLLGGKVRVHDVTWDAGVPVLMAALIFADLPWTWHGSGCHLSSTVALSRALTEAAQSRLTYIAGVRDDLPNRAWSLADEGYDRFVEPPPEIRLEHLEDLSTTSLDDDLAAIQERLAERSHDIFLADLTRPDFAGSVVRTYAPAWREAHYG